MQPKEGSQDDEKTPFPAKRPLFILSFMTRKNSIPDLKISPKNEDANRLRELAREMLTTLEDMKNRALSATDMDELRLLKIRIELLFGRKSLTGGLIELTDLLLKLTPEEAPKDDEEDDDSDINEGDIAAMERYVERWKADREPVSEEMRMEEMRLAKLEDDYLPP